MDVFISATGIWSSSSSMWPDVGDGDADLSDLARRLGGVGVVSVWVGRSKAMESPVCPLARLVR